MGTRKDDPAGPPRRRRRSKTELIRKAIKNIEGKIETNDVKATIGDLVRLLQIEKELEGEQPRDVKATWVESDEDASEK